MIAFPPSFSTLFISNIAWFGLGMCSITSAETTTSNESDATGRS